MFAPVTAGMGGMMLPDPGGMMPPRLGVPRTGMFGAGAEKPRLDLAGLLQGMIGGYLAGSGKPGGAAILSMMQQRQQAKDDDARYNRQREDGFEDWVRRQAYQAANPGPTNNDTVADYNFRVQTLGKEAADEWLRNPPQYMNVPGVGLVQIPRQQMGAPTAPVGNLTPIEGGPMPSASGGFRPSGH